MEAMSVTDKAVSAATTIERAYRERRGGFLAWAKRHAPDEASAEDALQDAFIRAISNADALFMVEDVAGWIFSAMRNRLIDLWRREDTQKRAGAVELSEETIEEIVADAGFDPHDALVREELEEALAVAVEALPKEQREVIQAQALDGTAFRELAEKTGVSIDTLMSRKRRALRKLAAAFEYWMED
jgi:RNA polymerase sigma factor (sigma-70 family)